MLPLDVIVLYGLRQGKSESEQNYGVGVRTMESLNVHQTILTLTLPEEENHKTNHPEVLGHHGVDVVADVAWLAVLRHRGHGQLLLLRAPAHPLHQHGVRDAALEGAPVGVLDVMEGIHKGGVVTVDGALGPSKLTKVVGDILEEDANQQHAEEGRQDDLHAYQPAHQPSEALDKEPSWSKRQILLNCIIMVELPHESFANQSQA